MIRVTNRLILSTSAGRALLAIASAMAWATPGVAQSDCMARDYRVVLQRWDAVLGRGLELRQNCSHPEWPARSVLLSPSVVQPGTPHAQSASMQIPVIQAFLVRAGETVRLWRQDDKARIEMYGMAEQAAKKDERVTVRVQRQYGDDGPSIERITGIVRGTGDVEMER